MASSTLVYGNAQVDGVLHSLTHSLSPRNNTTTPANRCKSCLGAWCSWEQCTLAVPSCMHCAYQSASSLADSTTRYGTPPYASMQCDTQTCSYNSVLVCCLLACLQFSSHNIFHIMVIMAALVHYSGVTDAYQHRAALRCAA